jgi:Flp pilus assembly protein TadD
MLVAVWRRRAIFAAALVFCLALAPALGFVNVYPFVFSFVADHFQYHAGIALFALIGAALAWLAQRWRFSRFAAAGGLTIIVVFLAAGTYSRSRIFVDSPTLYAATIAQNPNSFLAHNNMAAMMVTRHGPGDLQAAIQHAREALRVKPNNAEARFNLAVALDDLDDVQAAIVEYQELLRSFAAKPPPATKLIAVNRRLGLALARTGRAQESVPYLREAARLDVSDAVPLINLGAALVSLGEPIEAERVLEEAIRRDPGSGGAYYNLGNAFLIQRRYDDAARAFAEVLRLQPQDQQAQAALDRARRLGGK